MCSAVIENVIATIHKGFANEDFEFMSPPIDLEMRSKGEANLTGFGGRQSPESTLCITANGERGMTQWIRNDVFDPSRHVRSCPNSDRNSDPLER
jgi:hypothetical protein